MGYWIGDYDETDTPRSGGVVPTCSWHRLEEKELFGPVTFFVCSKCQESFLFNELKRGDGTIESRISCHKLPWE